MVTKKEMPTMSSFCNRLDEMYPDSRLSIILSPFEGGLWGYLMALTGATYDMPVVCFDVSVWKRFMRPWLCMLCCSGCGKIR